MGLRAALDSFGAKLAQFLPSRIQNLEAQDTPLLDVPGEPFPDKSIALRFQLLDGEGGRLCNSSTGPGLTLLVRWLGHHLFAFPQTVQVRQCRQEVKPCPQQSVPLSNVIVCYRVIGYRLRLCSFARLLGCLPKASVDSGSLRNQVGLPVRACPRRTNLRFALRKQLYLIPLFLVCFLVDGALTYI